MLTLFYFFYSFHISCIILIILRLLCCNPFTELRARGIKFGRFMKKMQARVVLEQAVLREEAMELRAMAGECVCSWLFGILSYKIFITILTIY